MEALTLTKSFLYSLLILILVFYAQTKPINETSIINHETVEAEWNGKHQQRQVVQPKWLKEEEETTIDPIVRVTNESLREVEALRKEIQKAVEENTYVVKGYEPPTEEDNLAEEITPITTGEKEKSEPPSMFSTLCFRNLLVYKSPKQFTPIFRAFWKDFMKELAQIK